jgi:hypothetical protein
MAEDPSPDRSYQEAFREKINQWKDSASVQKAVDWLNENSAKFEHLMSNSQLRDFVFEPIKDTFYVPGSGEALKARTIITQVAIVNAVIAGLPGSLGVGVYVSLSLEIWMAYALSRVVGLGLSRDEVVATLTGWALGVAGIFLLFKQVLNLVFPIVTAVMPFAGLGTAITQLVVTNLFGVMLWIMFEELKQGRNFHFPLTSAKRLISETRALLVHQYDAGVSALSVEKWKTISERFSLWFKGDIITDFPRLKGELSATVVMAWLLSGDYERLDGTLGSEFIQAIRDRYPDLADASVADIAEHMSSYDADQLVGVINLIKGKLFERLVMHAENEDADEWKAYLHDDESYPGSDIIFENENGDRVDLSLKASDSTGYLEEALLKYPEFPIIATDEVAQLMADNPKVFASGLTNEELTRVTEENFEKLVSDLQMINEVSAAAASAGTQAVVTLWPFVAAYVSGRIDKDQLQTAILAVFPETGTALASRMVYAVALGPVFAWWLLARGVMKTVEVREEGGGKVLARLSVT